MPKSAEFRNPVSEPAERFDLSPFGNIVEPMYGVGEHWIGSMLK
ncbi:MAG: hypothetical protein ACK50J_01650 [Planctomyces sp.]